MASLSIRRADQCERFVHFDGNGCRWSPAGIRVGLSPARLRLQQLLSPRQPRRMESLPRGLATRPAASAGAGRRRAAGASQLYPTAVPRPLHPPWHGTRKLQLRQMHHPVSQPITGVDHACTRAQAGSCSQPQWVSGGRLAGSQARAEQPQGRTLACARRPWHSPSAPIGAMTVPPCAKHSWWLCCRRAAAPISWRSDACRSGSCGR